MSSMSLLTDFFLFLKLFSVDSLFLLKILFRGGLFNVLDEDWGIVYCLDNSLTINALPSVGNSTDPSSVSNWF